MLAIGVSFAHTTYMQSPLAGRNHLWLWMGLGLFLYVASCPPVEAWYEKHASGAVSVPMMPSAASAAGTPPAPDPGEFQIIELSFMPPPPQPRWMQIFYAPVHWVAQFPPFDRIYRHSWKWCYDVV